MGGVKTIGEIMAVPHIRAEVNKIATHYGSLCGDPAKSGREAAAAHNMDWFEASKDNIWAFRILAMAQHTVLYAMTEGARLFAREGS